MKRIALLAVLLSLGACASDTGPAPAPPPPMLVAPPKARPQVNADACGAHDLQDLIGHPRTDIPVPLHPSMRRVLCMSCPMTEDFAPMRQTILYDAETGLVRVVRCG
jgi:hypothetical protein